MPGRLNIFQKAMIEWNDLHPYNAVHVVRMSEAPDVERLRNAIRGTLEHHGLSHLTLNHNDWSYHYHGGPECCEIKIIAGGEDARDSVCAEIEHQLNTPFAQGERINPFRFFVAPESDAFSLGLVYLHAVADAEALVCLLRDILDAYARSSGRASPDRAELYPRCRDGLLRQSPGLLARKLCALPSVVINTRRTCRPRYLDVHNLGNGFAFLALKPEHLLRLLETRKSSGVTLNDLFLALLMKILSPLAGHRMEARRRTRVSIGCIANIRKDLGLENSRTFGLFLGSFIITHDVPDEISLTDLARDIRRQTLRIKRQRLCLGTPLELVVGRLMLSLFSTERRKTFYQKHFPLWGGLTNMNLNVYWQQAHRQKPADYFRAVSTGPVTPLVLSVTTIGDVVNLGLTYRKTVFSAGDITGMQQRLVETVAGLERGA